jgi:predicted dithiol-disulfide oxidoreductase (DUF899 family)
MEITFPNESAEYREARRALLQREIALRREMESVARDVRSLPPGGKVPEDYVFDGLDAKGNPAKIRLSALFRENTDTLFLYHFMFPRHKDDDRPKATSGPMAALPIEAGPCPSCTAFLDQLDGAIPHVEAAGANFAAVAKAPLDRVIAFARDRGWRHLRLLSAANNRFKRDYHGEDEQGQQVPMLTVFHRSGDGIRMSWASEMFYAPTDPGQDPRHNGTLEPLWTLFDLTPGGRPDFAEQIEYRHGQV